MYDVQKVRREINEVSLAIRDIKIRLRESHQPNVRPGDHWQLYKLKHRATLLCSLRASMRGKVHLKRFASTEDQLKFLGSFGKDYVRVEQAA